MNQALVDQVVQAVLYEGYILYPYRASAKKNRQRFTFGRVYPEAYSAAENGAEPCLMQTQCLIEGPAAAKLAVTVRFLHPMAREIGRLEAPLQELPKNDRLDFFHEVAELEVEGKLYQSWQEAVERTVSIPARALGDVAVKWPFSFPASRTIEPIYDRDQSIVGVIVRRQEGIEGVIEIGVESIQDSGTKITVRILNRTPVAEENLSDANRIVMQTFASTHTILQAEDGEFISALEPPEKWAEAVASCQNIGTWPILVGDEEKKERDTMVSSPIILYDYPKIAPESPGDLFDGGEIDEILSLRILTMTDEEKREMRGVDDAARRILERTEALPNGDLLKMHGMMRGAGAERTPLSFETPGAFGEEFFNPATRTDHVVISGVEMHVGSRVRIRPKSRADAMDMALAGKIGIIESIEQDAENKMHLALVLEDDPGRDLGFLRQPGHRFFYGTDEVEPL